MNFRRTAFLVVVFILIPLAHARAQDGRELYHAEVCNEGQITVDVAVAYRDFGVNDEFWRIDYWYPVKPGECGKVFSHFYARQNVLNFRPFPVHLAFAFTDSTGVWGAAKVRPPGKIAPSRLQLCVTETSYEYKLSDEDPSAECKRNLKALLIPASIDWEPTNGSVYDGYNGYGRPARFTVALGPNDRAIPLGPKSPGTILDFAEVLKDIIRRSGKTTDPNWGWSACIEPVVVKTHSWKNPPAATVKPLQDAVIQFLSIHGEGTANARSSRPNHVKFKIIERSGNFVVEEYSGDYCDPFYGIH